MNKLTTDLLDVVAVLDLGEVARCTRCAREPSLRQARERGVPVAELALMALPSISYMKISRNNQKVFFVALKSKSYVKGNSL